MVKKEERKSVPTHVKFIVSAMAGCGAITVIQPLDVVKFRMQVSGEKGQAREFRTAFGALIGIPRKHGFLALYDGFSANIARQLTYTTMRMGLFQYCLESFKKNSFEGFKAQVTSSVIAGLIASVFANPIDVSLTRMALDSRLPVDRRRAYKWVGNALLRIYVEEGVAGLWSGVVPQVTRAVAGNVLQLVSYKQSKDYILEKEIAPDGLKTHFLASAWSGLIYAGGTAPLDVAKTRLQNMKRPDEYKGMWGVMVTVTKQEGFYSLWKGFGPYYLRIAPFTMLLFIMTEYLLKKYRQLVLNDYSEGGGI